MVTRSPLRSGVVLCAVSACALVLFALSTSEARASWPSKPDRNLPVCTAAGSQGAPDIVSDGAGGAIVTWEDDRRPDDRDLYAQRMDSTGTLLWTRNGVPLCTAPGEQRDARILSDGRGGAIVVWHDHRNPAGWDVYAQRLGPHGTPLWAADGVCLTAASGDQMSPGIVGDGRGGAVVAWEDRRSGASTDIYAQLVDSTGTTRWAVDGIMVCGSTGDQLTPRITAAGAAGSIVTWQDGRTSGDRPGIYAQLLSRAGEPMWTADGVTVCADADANAHPMPLSDGAGGVIVAWDDLHIYAQRVDSSGRRLWTADGVRLSTGVGTVPAVAASDAGEAIVTWRGGGEDEDAGDISAQRIGADGSLRWPGGAVVCAAVGLQTLPAITSDGAGGAIVSWEDDRTGFLGDIYAQRVDSTGASLWAENGVVLCTAPGEQYAPTIAPDGAGGAIIAWQDERAGRHIYAQRVDPFGHLGGTVRVSSTARRAAGTNLPLIPSGDRGRPPRVKSKSKLDGGKLP